MTPEVAIDPGVRGLQLGIVFAEGIRLAPPSAEQLVERDASVAALLASGTAGGDARREAVRRMLRAGGFKPSGRNKPAQEYLLRTATETGTLPTILNAVDHLNLISLSCGLPISLLATERIGPRAMVRYGRAGERFVFNRSGQELDTEGLICVCGDENGSTPLGTPIKDSMAGKVTESDQAVFATIYAPESVNSEELADWTRLLADGFHRWCAAECRRLQLSSESAASPDTSNRFER